MWGEDEDWVDDEEAAEEDGFDTEFYNGKKNVAVILIDVGVDMFDSGAFLRCVNALIQIIEGILLKSYRNSICVGFIGDNTIGPLIQFHTNIVDAIKYLKSYRCMSAADLKAQNARKQPVQMRYVLTECMKLFERLDKINPHVVLLTSDDEPHKGATHSAEDLAAYNIASAFRAMNTKLIVLPLRKQFRMDKFYLKLMKTANGIEDEDDDDVGVNEDVYLTEDSLIQILTTIIKHDSNPRRHIFRLYHSDDVKPFWVQMRYLVDKTHLYKNLHKSRITGNKVVKQFRPGSLVDRSQLMLQKQGSKSVRVAKSAKLNQSQKPGFQLLYVSKTNRARKHFQNKRVFLLQNDDIGNDEHADLTFRYFWEFCSNPASPRYPMCSFYTPGHRQHPKLVQLTADTFQSKPCFLGTFCPSVDQIQRFSHQYQKFEEPVPQVKDPDDPKFGLICDMIDKLTITFNPNLYKDPKHEQKAVVLTAKLQNEPLHQLVYENTLPTPESVTERLGATSEYLKPILNKKNTGPAGKKRKRPKN